MLSCRSILCSRSRLLAEDDIKEDVPFLSWTHSSCYAEDIPPAHSQRSSGSSRSTWQASSRRHQASGSCYSRSCWEPWKRFRSPLPAYKQRVQEVLASLPSGSSRTFRYWFHMWSYLYPWTTWSDVLPIQTTLTLTSFGYAYVRTKAEKKLLSFLAARTNAWSSGSSATAFASAQKASCKFSPVSKNSMDVFKL